MFAVVFVLAAVTIGVVFVGGDDIREDVGDDLETGSSEVVDGVCDGYISYWSVVLPLLLFGALFLNNRGETDA